MFKMSIKFVSVETYYVILFLLFNLVMKETIRIYARLKPLDNEKPCQFDVLGSLDDQEATSPREALQLYVPKPTTDFIVNNSREVYKFLFDKIFPQNASQLNIFNEVARPIVDRVLEGYNGTLFAYGQTGSGKTHTITGPPHNTDASESGIIPRTLSYIFDKVIKRNDQSSICVSYFEIYNECAYDLLQSRDYIYNLEDLTKIILLEDADQNIHLRNLSVHPVAAADEALDLFRIGEMNRAMADMPMNRTSTRSHCIFTVVITSRSNDSAIICTSKLHVIDLAGSERVYKSGIAGRSLTEAKFINLGLHHLEQVILALADKQRAHVPYRNSIMTSILKDSLGGNSLTSMIANCSLEDSNLGETISTCRFAQRVAMVKNEVVRNESCNLQIENELLKKQIQTLKTSYTLLSGKESVEGPLEQNEIDQCRELVDKFLESDCDLSIPDMDWRKIQLAFNFLKNAVIDTRIQKNSSSENEEIAKLRTSLAQRDGELAILCKLLRQEKKKIDHMISLTPEAAVNLAISINAPAVIKENFLQFQPPEKCVPWISSASSLDMHQLDELRRALLASFVGSHPDRIKVEELKNSLNGCVGQAQELGKQIRTTQDEITKGREQLHNIGESIRCKRLLTCSVDEEERQEAVIEGHLNVLKARLQGMLQKLKSLKGEVDFLENNLRKYTDRMQEQFDHWWSVTVLTCHGQDAGSGDCQDS